MISLESKNKSCTVFSVVIIFFDVSAYNRLLQMHIFIVLQNIKFAWTCFKKYLVVCA